MRMHKKKLDCQEQLVHQLTMQNDELTQTVEMLKAELIASDEAADRALRELETMRNSVLEDSAHESYVRERELRETQAELEQCRM